MLYSQAKRITESRNSQFTTCHIHNGHHFHIDWLLPLKAEIGFQSLPSVQLMMHAHLQNNNISVSLCVYSTVTRHADFPYTLVKSSEFYCRWQSGTHKESLLIRINVGI